MHFVPIVEGHGDAESVPIVLRRLAQSLGCPEPIVAQPIRCPRHRITKVKELERVIALAAAKLTDPGRILILLDADSDCPAKLGPKLLESAKRGWPALPVSVVLAKQEYEAWFLAALSSLSGRRGLRKGLPPVADAESVRGAKERLQSLMEEGRKYSETVDQPAMSALFDVELCRRNSPSFDKFWREVEGALTGRVS